MCSWRPMVMLPAEVNLPVAGSYRSALGLDVHKRTISYCVKDSGAKIHAAGFHARSGALLYPEFNYDINVCAPFPIPHDWTRRMAIDPHKRRPHAFLWMAVSPDGDHYYYREYWPSRITRSISGGYL